MQITNIQTGDTFEVIDTVFNNNLVHVRITILGKDFVITLSKEEYDTVWQ